MEVERGEEIGDRRRNVEGGKIIFGLEPTCETIIDKCTV